MPQTVKSERSLVSELAGAPGHDSISWLKKRKHCGRLHSRVIDPRQIDDVCIHDIDLNKRMVFFK